VCGSWGTLLGLEPRRTSQGTWLSSHRRSGTWTAQADLCLGRGSARRVVTSRSCRVHHCCSERFVLAPYSRQYAWCRSHWTCACCSHCMISKNFQKTFNVTNNLMSQLHCTSSLIREHGRSDVHGMFAWLAKGGQGRPHSQSPACTHGQRRGSVCADFKGRH